MYYKQVLHYLYTTYPEKITDFQYVSTNLVKSYDWRDKFKNNKVKILHPLDCDINVEFETKQIHITLQTITKEGHASMVIVPHGCSTIENEILKVLHLENDDKEVLINFVDKAKLFCENQNKKSKESTSKTININYWKKDYWHMIFKCPKRPIETLYLKEGQKECLLRSVEEFYSEETRDEYVSFGIPYKQVVLIHGVPGSGKTSAIRAIASHFDCNIFVIPVSKELTDYGLIDAISYIDSEDSNKERKRIIVIEDIDCIFTDRKKGDNENMVTLQGLLNCFDGFSCIEGTLLFLTANKPEVLDDALIRSCRIDLQYEFGYADEYQTRCIYEMMFPDKKDEFPKFYKKIETKEFTTAMLQEFLFFNRKKGDILSKVSEFNEIIEKNKVKHFEKKKQDFYM